jgi:hypothetical protein
MAGGLVFPGAPNVDEIRCASLTANGTLVTIPAGKWYTGTVSISGSITVAGACNPTVAISGNDASDVNGTVLARMTLQGLALTALANSTTTDILVKAGANDIDLVFTAGAAGVSSVTCNGYVMG